MSGYPPEDLVLKKAFTDACQTAIEKLASATVDGAGIIVGCPLRRDSKIYNMAVVLDDGKIVAEVKKYDLPNYSEFDEKRVFTSGESPLPLFFVG